MIGGRLLGRAAREVVRELRLLIGHQGIMLEATEGTPQPASHPTTQIAVRDVPEEDAECMKNFRVPERQS